MGARETVCFLDMNVIPEAFKSVENLDQLALDF